jgi:hypothetical protein
VQSGRNIPMFQSNILLQSSGSKNESLSAVRLVSSFVLLSSVCSMCRSYRSVLNESTCITQHSL